MKKRVLAMFLTIVMTLGFLPGMTAIVSAENATPRFPVDLSYGRWEAHTYFSGHNDGSYSAIDITIGAQTRGQPVYAVEDGVIQGYSAADGLITIKHTKALITTDGYMFSTWYSRYMHMTGILKKTLGTSIKKGEKIGDIGAVGNATGPHLHFQIMSSTAWEKKYQISPYYVAWSNANSNLYWGVGGSQNPAGNEKLRDWTPGKVSGAVPYSATRPPAPSNVSLSPTNIGIDTAITGSWSAVSGADKYKVELFYNNSKINEYEEKATDKATLSKTFSDVTKNAGQYFIRVYAHNSVDWSVSSDPSAAITVHPDKTVTFLNWDGIEIEKPQSVKYGGAAVAPKAPSREGYTWQGWDKAFDNVISDITVTATYSKNRYNVRFIGDKGAILKTEQVYYLEAATPPSVTPPTGYRFVGWDRQDYLSVKSALDITAVFEWENPNLPNIITINSAVRNSSQTGYDINISTQNFPAGATQGRVIAALKTAAGKMVAVTTEQYRLDQLANATRSIYIPYSGVATTAEISIVGVLDDDNTGVPLAQLARKNIDLSLEWSDWSEKAPPQGGDLITESKNQYRFRDKQTETSASATMNGWTLYDYNVTGWNAWSAWQNSSVAETYNGKNQKTREVQTQTIAAQYKTVWKYERWVSSDGKASANYNIAGRTYQSITLDYRLSNKGGSPPRYGTYVGTYGTYLQDWWWNEKSQQLQTAAAYTQWHYRDAITTYDFYKWTDWSDWLDGTAPMATADKEVEKRTVHRFKSNDLGVLEDISGTQRNISGSINAPNKLATLLVFRQTNQDPTASQLQYVDQTVLGANGEYNFDFRTKDEPSGLTGDFIIMLAVEGGTSPVYIGKIEAPKPLYTVVFADEDGTELSRQTVAEGNSAVLPPNPAKEGYNFTGWDDTTTNIWQDITIAATYAKKKFTVVFVDQDYGDVEIIEFEYGDTLYLEAPPEKEGSSFAGWVNANDENITVVTQNMIVSAKYTLNKYTITFTDWEGNTIDEQEVEYGDEAVLPDAPALAGMNFAGWSDYYALSFAYTDITVYPLYAYDETVSEPIANVKSGNYTDTQYVSLSCVTPEVKLFYCLLDTSLNFDSDCILEAIDVDWTEYTSPIAITSSTSILFFAAKDGMNDSEYGVEQYIFTKALHTSTLLLNTLTKSNNTVSGLVGVRINNIGSAETADLILAVYSTANNKLSGVVKKSVTLNNGYNDVVFDSISFSNATEDKYYGKILVWNAINKMEPIGEMLTIDVN